MLGPGINVGLVWMSLEGLVIAFVAIDRGYNYTADASLKQL